MGIGVTEALERFVAESGLKVVVTMSAAGVVVSVDDSTKAHGDTIGEAVAAALEQVRSGAREVAAGYARTSSSATRRGDLAWAALTAMETDSRSIPER